MRGRRTRPGPKARRNALQIIHAYLALTTGVIRSADPAVTALWHGKTYKELGLAPSPLPESLRDSEIEHGLTPRATFSPSDEIVIPLSRREAIEILGRHFGFIHEHLVKFLRRHGVAGLPSVGWHD